MITFKKLAAFLMIFALVATLPVARVIAEEISEGGDVPVGGVFGDGENTDPNDEIIEEIIPIDGMSDGDENTDGENTSDENTGGENTGDENIGGESGFGFTADGIGDGGLEIGLLGDGTDETDIDPHMDSEFIATETGLDEGIIAENETAESSPEDEIIDVLIPLSIIFTIDPYDLSGRGTVYSESFVIENNGENDVYITFPEITLTFANETDFKPLSHPFYEDVFDPEREPLKAIYLTLDFGREEIEPVIMTAPDPIGPSILLSADDSELSYCALSISGNVNPYPDKDWKNGDVKINIAYSLDTQLGMRNEELGIDEENEDTQLEIDEEEYDEELGMRNEELGIDDTQLGIRSEELGVEGDDDTQLGVMNEELGVEEDDDTQLGIDEEYEELEIDEIPLGEGVLSDNYNDELEIDEENSPTQDLDITDHAPPPEEDDTSPPEP